MTETTSKPEVIIDACALHRVAPAVSTDQVRGYISMCNIEPLVGGGVVAVATDGHILVANIDPNGTVKEGLEEGVRVLPSRELMRDIARAGKKRKKVEESSDITLEIGPAETRLHNGKLTDWRSVTLVDGNERQNYVCPANSEGTFPSWHRVLVRRAVASVGGPYNGMIQPRFITRILKGLACDISTYIGVPGRDAPQLAFYGSVRDEDSRPVLVRASHTPYYVAVFMPHSGALEAATVARTTYGDWLDAIGVMPEPSVADAADCGGHHGQRFSSAHLASGQRRPVLFGTRHAHVQRRGA